MIGRRSSTGLALVAAGLTIGLAWSAPTTAQVTPIEEIPPPPGGEPALDSATTAQLSRRGESIVIREDPPPLPEPAPPSSAPTGSLPDVLQDPGQVAAAQTLPEDPRDFSVVFDRSGERGHVVETTRWTAVSGDGCTVVSLSGRRPIIVRFAPEAIANIAIPTLDVSVRRMCSVDPTTGARVPLPPTPPVIHPIQRTVEPEIGGRPAVDHHGTFAVVPTRQSIIRIDLVSGNSADMPLEEPYLPQWTRDRDDEGLVDITPDGRYIAAAVQEFSTFSHQAISVWDSTQTASKIVNRSTSDRGTVLSRWPTLSYDARFVSYTSNAHDLERRVLDRLYVTELDASGDAIGTTGSGVFGTDDMCAVSMSEDATQLAFVHAAPDGDCRKSDHALTVVWTTVRGFTTETYETEVIAARGRPRAWRPDLSGSGRFVAWDIGESTLPRLTKDSQRVLVAQRGAALRVDNLDFGEVERGQFVVLPTTVRNVGASSLMPQNFTATAPFTLEPGGTCETIVWLSPQNTCTVRVGYTGPTTGGMSTGELVVSERGYLALEDRARLTGFSPEPTPVIDDGPIIPDDPPDDPPDDSIPPDEPPDDTGPTTTPPPPTTTTLPPITPNPSLGTDPDSIDFGPVDIDTSSPEQIITITNTGNTTLTPSVTVTGVDPDDFQIVQNSCLGSIVTGATCSVGIRFTPSESGERSAELDIDAGSVDTTIPLDGLGWVALRLQAFPEAATIDDVVNVVGSGFPIDAPTTVEVVSDDGLTVLTTFAVTPDENGVVRSTPDALDDLDFGRYLLRIAPDPAAHNGIVALFTIVAGTVQPQAPAGLEVTGFDLVSRR